MTAVTNHKFFAIADTIRPGLYRILWGKVSKHSAEIEASSEKEAIERARLHMVGSVIPDLNKRP